MLIKVKVLETGESLDVEFYRYPSPGDIGTIRTMDGRALKCEAACVPVSQEEGLDSDGLGILVQLIDE